MAQQYILGMRIEIRDAEWRIQRVDRSTGGGYLLNCQGLLGIIRGRHAQFLTKLEGHVRILDPMTAELIDDLSSGYRAVQLFINTALRLTPPADNKVHIGHQAAMDILPFQLDPVLHAAQTTAPTYFNRYLVRPKRPHHLYPKQRLSWCRLGK